MDELGTLGGKHSVGYGINRGGDVTGAASTGYRDAMHAFWYDYNYGSMTDLGTLGGSSSYGEDINDRRQITGAANIVGDMAAHAFLYSAGVMRDIGTLGGSFSVGFSINTAGVVTGASSIAGNAGSHAFLYVNEAMLDLNQLLDPSEVLSTTVTLTRATDINDAGQIVADGLDRNTGQTHAYLLTPRSALGRSASDHSIVERIDHEHGWQSVDQPGRLSHLLWQKHQFVDPNGAGSKCRKDPVRSQQSECRHLVLCRRGIHYVRHAERLL
jgi:probable HAF family extracellular repeat protein